MLAGLVELRRVFLLTAGFYAVGLVIVHCMYDDRATHAAPGRRRQRPGDLSQRAGLSEFRADDGGDLRAAVRRPELGPVLPLWVEQTGVAPARVALTSGVLFSIMAITGALGHHFCGQLLRRYAGRVVIAGGMAIAGSRRRRVRRSRATSGSWAPPRWCSASASARR